MSMPYMTEETRMQILNLINKKFYVHKSFDIQSDLEFLPYIPATSNFTPTIKNPISNSSINRDEW